MTSYRVLIVDDQREISRLLRSALETLHHELEVVEAPSGEEAILVASRKKVDLLVADYRLPGISGVELMKKIRARIPEVKVILITGMADPKIRDEIQKIGADASFIKPVPMADFLDSVERSLGLTRTILPSEPLVEKPEDRKTLSNLMANLRKELDASGVALLSERGRIMAQAGELPDQNMEVTLTSALMAIFSAAQKVSRFVSQSPSTGAHLFQGEQTDLVFVPVGALHAVLAAGAGIGSPENMSRTLHAIQAAQAELDRALRSMGVTGPLAPETVARIEADAKKALVDEAPADELSKLLTKSKSKMKAADVDAFWDTAAEQASSQANPDMLSFEQAQKLGLTPDDAQK